MRRTAIILAFLAAAALFAAGRWAAAESDGSFAKWLSGAAGFEEASRRHQKSGTPLWVYFYTDWCGYCRQLNTEILSSDTVHEAMDDVVAVRINPDRGVSEQELAKQFGVTGYPSFFVIPEDGTEYQQVRPHRQEGSQWIMMKPGEFVTACKAAAEKPRVKRAPRPAGAAVKPPVPKKPVRAAPPVPSGPLKNQVTLHLTSGETITGELLRETPEAVTLRWEYGDAEFQRTEFTRMVHHDDQPAVAEPTSPANL